MLRRLPTGEARPAPKPVNPPLIVPAVVRHSSTPLIRESREQERTTTRLLAAAEASVNVNIPDIGLDREQRPNRLTVSAQIERVLRGRRRRRLRGAMANRDEPIFL